jgi:hypothetical protein
MFLAILYGHSFWWKLAKAGDYWIERLHNLRFAKAQKSGLPAWQQSSIS